MTSMPRFPALVLVTQGVLLLAACGPAAESPDAEERAHRVDPIRLAPCESEDGPAEDLLLGSLEVPEDWSRPGGRSISLGITVLPARAAVP
jgi:hypothetical protein